MWTPTPALCPSCGKNTDAHTPVKAIPTVPHDGDYALCMYCGVWSVFELGALRLPTTDEIHEIAARPDCVKASFAWLIMQMQNRNKS